MGVRCDAKKTDCSSPLPPAKFGRTGSKGAPTPAPTPEEILDRRTAYSHFSNLAKASSSCLGLEPCKKERNVNVGDMHSTVQSTLNMSAGASSPAKPEDFKNILGNYAKDLQESGLSPRDINSNPRLNTFLYMGGEIKIRVNDDRGITFQYHKEDTANVNGKTVIISKESRYL